MDTLESVEDPDVQELEQEWQALEDRTTSRSTSLEQASSGPKLRRRGTPSWGMDDASSGWVRTQVRPRSERAAHLCHGAAAVKHAPCLDACCLEVSARPEVADAWQRCTYLAVNALQEEQAELLGYSQSVL